MTLITTSKQLGRTTYQEKNARDISKCVVSKEPASHMKSQNARPCQNSLVNSFEMKISVKRLFRGKRWKKKKKKKEKTTQYYSGHYFLLLRGGCFILPF